MSSQLPPVLLYDLWPHGPPPCPQVRPRREHSNPLALARALSQNNAAANQQIRHPAHCRNKQANKSKHRRTRKQMAASPVSSAPMTVNIGTASRSPFAGGRCLTARVCVPLPCRRSGSVAVKALFTRNKQADVSGRTSTPSIAGQTARVLCCRKGTSHGECAVWCWCKRLLGVC